MEHISEAAVAAISLILSGDADLFEIVGLSLFVSLTATLCACIIGIPIGAALAISRFRGRGACLVVLNALMGLPPVVIGLFVYLYLSRSGPLGFLGLLYTPTAMIIAQTILIAPIVAALSREVLERMFEDYGESFRALGLSKRQMQITLVFEARFALVTVALAGFGRAIAEVGAVMIVGGNIDHLTRVMTTAIALETSKGNLSLALALGFVLLAAALFVNVFAHGLKATSESKAYV